MNNNNEPNITEGRYLNPLTDYGFKKVFDEKDIMIAFLTDLLNPKFLIFYITAMVAIFGLSLVMLLPRTRVAFKAPVPHIHDFSTP